MADTPTDSAAYFKFFNTSGVYIDTLADATNEWRIIQELNTPVSMLSISFQTTPVTLYESNLAIHYNEVEVWIKSKTNPSGLLKYNGYIDSYELDYDTDTITLNLKSYGAFLDTTVYESGSNTTITHSAVDLAVIIKAALDNHVAQGGKISYTAGTIPSTGISVTYTFNTATVLEVVNKCLEIAGDTFYWYIDMATNYLTFKPFDLTTVNHRIALGEAIIGLKTEKALLNAANAIYFTGGDTGGGVNLYKKYTDAGNKALQAGLPIARRVQDERVTLSATAATISNAKLDIGADISTTEIMTIAGDSASIDGYAIDTIDLGETVFVGNIADIDTQVEAVRYTEFTPDRLKIYRGRLRKDPNRVTQENGEDVKMIYTQDNPTAPS